MSKPLVHKRPSIRRKAGKRYLKSLNQLEGMEEVQKNVRETFQEAQRTVSVHKTQVVILRTLYERSRELGHLDEFTALICKLINKILPVKRKDPAADRIVKFVSSFTTAINPNLKRDGTVEDTDVIDLEDDEAFSEYVGSITSHLLRGLEASNKNVRYRVCHLLSHLMHNMSAIDKDLFEKLSRELLVRIYDREPSVRMKAVATLASFQEPDGTNNISDAAKKLRVIMQNDSNPEVRRVCMKQIEKNRFTQHYIFERARDVNSVNRRLLYSYVLPRFGDFRTIDADDRNNLLNWGLKDRDDNVKKAAVKWITDNWMSTLKGDVLEFVERLKVTDNKMADVAVKDLLEAKPELAKKLSFNADVLKNLTSEYALLYRVFFQYCNDHNEQDLLDENFLEAAEFADILQLYFSKRRKNLILIMKHEKELSEDKSGTPETLHIVDPQEYDYVILQLLLVASDYDYHDEFGRSKMLNVLRSILAQEGLNAEIIDVLVLCIRRLSISERDFSQMIVEIVNDMRDSAYEDVLKKKAADGKLPAVDDSFQGDVSLADANGDNGEISEDDDDNDDNDDDDDFVDAATSMSRASIRNANKSREQELAKETAEIAELPAGSLVDCLTITKRMLQLVKKPLKDNMYLASILRSLIRPSLQRTEVEARVLALSCMGLCCILDKDLAIRNMFLCGVFITKSDNDELIIAGLKVITDLLAVHGVSILGVDVEGSIDSMAVAKLFYRTLRDSSRKSVQAVSGEALYKLFLSGVINDDELFETTLLAYFNPAINDNEALKQCLSFCIPVFAFSHVSHQEQIARVVSDTLVRLFSSWDDMKEETGGEMPFTPQTIIEQLLYWTDPYRIVGRDPEDAKQSSIQIDVGIQLLKVLEQLDNSPRYKACVRAIFMLLPKLTFTEMAGLSKLQTLLTALEGEDLLQGGIEDAMKNSHYRNAFAKLELYVEACIEKAEEDPMLKEEMKTEKVDGSDKTSAESFSAAVDKSTESPIEQSSFIDEEEKPLKRKADDSQLLIDQPKKKLKEEENETKEQVGKKDANEDGSVKEDGYEKKEKDEIVVNDKDNGDSASDQEQKEQVDKVNTKAKVKKEPPSTKEHRVAVKKEAEEQSDSESDYADESSIIIISDDE